MMDEQTALLPSPETTLVIILGVYECPRARSSFPAYKAFKVAAEKIYQYFVHIAGIPTDNVLWLFDTKLNAVAIDEKIRAYLAEFPGKARDVIVYYVGHGGRSEHDQLYLAIQSAREDNLEGTSLKAKNLIETVSRQAHKMRHFYIFDCCFAAAAIKNLQGSNVANLLPDAVREGEADAIEEVEYETRGYTGLFSSSMSKSSVVLPDDSNTFFTEAFLRVLARHNSASYRPLSVQDVYSGIDDTIYNLYLAYLTTHPKEESVQQPPLVQHYAGDLYKVPLFPPHNDPTLIGKIVIGDQGINPDISIVPWPQAPQIAPENKVLHTEISSSALKLMRNISFAMLYPERIRLPFFVTTGRRSLPFLRNQWLFSSILIVLVLAIILIPLKLWFISSPNRGTLLSTYSGHTDVVDSVGWSPDGTQIATSSLDNTMQIWNANSGVHQKTYSYGSDPYAIVWLPGGPLIAALKSNATIEVRNANEQTVLIWPFPISSYGPDTNGFSFSHLTWSPDGKYLAFASAANGAQWVAVYILDIAQKKLLVNQPIAQAVGTVVNSIAWSPDSTSIAYTDSTDGNIRVINIAGEQILQYDPYGSFNGGVGALAWSPDGKDLVSGAANGTPASSTGLVCVADAQTGKVVYTYKGHSSGITSIAWSPNDKYIASADDTNINVWDAFTGKDAYIYNKQPGQIVDLAWSPDSTRIASGGAGQKNGTGEAIVWQAV